MKWFWNKGGAIKNFNRLVNEMTLRGKEIHRFSDLYEGRHHGYKPGKMFSTLARRVQGWLTQASPNKYTTYDDHPALGADCPSIASLNFVTGQKIEKLPADG